MRSLTPLTPLTPATFFTPLAVLTLVGVVALGLLIVFVLLATMVALMASRGRRMRGVESSGPAIRVTGLCALLALGAEHAAAACRRALAATLSWGTSFAPPPSPPPPSISAEPDVTLPESPTLVTTPRAPMTLTTPRAPTLHRLHRLHSASRVTHVASVNQTQDPAPLAEEERSTRVVAWPGIMILSRLLTLALALCLLLGDYTVNVLRVPAVQFQAQSGRPPLVALDVTSGLLWLALAAFWGLLALEFLDVVPRCAQVFPHLRPRMRRTFTAIALVGFTLTVLTVGLLYVAGQLLIQAITWPLAPVLISALQGVLLSSVAVVALWALVPGVVAILSLLCLALIGLFSVLGVFFRAIEILL